jgi:hypothetical protein
MLPLSLFVMESQLFPVQSGNKPNLDYPISIPMVHQPYWSKSKRVQSSSSERVKLMIGDWGLIDEMGPVMVD